MGNERSQALGAFTGKARRLLVTMAENAATLPDISVERAILERELSTVEEAKNRQDAFAGEKQRATQEMNNAVGRAREAVLQLQSAAKFKLGPHNEKLVSFLVKPLRKRGPSKAARLRKQEQALAEKEAKLAEQRKDADLLRREVEILKREVAAAELNK